MPGIRDKDGSLVWDRSGPPPTGDDLRAVVAEAGLAEQFPVTAALMEEFAQLADNKTGNRDRDDAATTTAIVKAIMALEGKIVSMQPDGHVD